MENKNIPQEETDLNPTHPDESPSLDKKEIEGMFEGPVLPLVLKLSFPILMGMLFQLLYNVVDTIWISRIDLNDPSYVGGTGLIWPIIFFAIALGNGLTVGVSSLVARAIGEKNHDVLNKTVESGLVIALGLSVVTVLGIGFFGPQIVSAMGGTGDFYIHGLEYLFYIMPTAVLFYIGGVFFGILQGEGLMKPVMTGMIIGTLANIILDPVFIFLLKLNVKGAAIATGLGQLFSVAYVLRVFIRNKSLVTIKWNIKNIKLAIIKKILVIGIPQSLGQILMSISFLLLNRLIIQVDVLALTAFTLCGRMEQVVLMPSFAIGAAVITIVGQNGGRGKMDRVALVMRSSYLSGTAAVIVLATLMVLLAKYIYPFFSGIDQVVRYAVLQTYYLEYTYIFAVFGIVGRSFFQAIGYPVPALLLTLLRVLIISIPAAYIFVLVFNMGIPGIWIGLIVGGTISGFTGLYLVFRTLGRLKRGEMEIRHT